MSALPSDPAPSRCRVLIADPLPLYASALASVLTGREYEVRTVGGARAAIYDAWNHPLDLLVCAVDLPDQSAFRVLHWCRRNRPQIKVVLLADLDEDEVRYAAVKAGAAAYLCRQLPGAALADAIDRVTGGDFVLSGDWPAPAAYPTRAHLPEYMPISQRELEVLGHIAHGKSNKGIALAMGVSDQTVKNHITHILRRLQCNDRTQAAIYALERGWVSNVTVGVEDA